LKRPKYWSQLWAMMQLQSAPRCWRVMLRLANPQSKKNQIFEGNDTGLTATQSTFLLTNTLRQHYRVIGSGSVSGLQIRNLARLARQDQNREP
jgi:hypothetical protein